MFCSGHVKVVQVILQKEVDVNTEDATKLTPLHFSAREGEICLIQFYDELFFI